MAKPTDSTHPPETSPSVEKSQQAPVPLECRSGMEEAAGLTCSATASWTAATPSHTHFLYFHYKEA